MAEIEEVGVEAVVKGFGAFILKLEAMNTAIGSTGVASATSAVGVAAFTLALAAVAAIAVAVIAGIGLIVGGFAAISIGSINVARSVETAFAGVAKTTDGLTDEFGKMNEAGAEVLDQFRELAKEVPLALEELLGIGELAGQLGIAKDALVGFSEVVAALAATTDLTVEKATLGLARIANIYEITAEDMVTNTEAIGSALVFLGNNFATTEGEILDFAKRIAGVAKIAGITQTEILAIGTAFTSVGIEAQAGGTAVQTVIIEMTKAAAEGGENLELFAEVSGKSVDAFVEGWETDAAGAFNDFVQGLGDAGDDAFQILEDLGISDRRITRAFLSVAGAGDLMTDAIDGANDAFEENTALARETEIRYATFDSQMQIFKNTIRDIGLEIGMFLLPMLSDLLEIVTPIVEAIGEGLVPAFKSIFDAITTSLLPALGDLLDAFGFDITNASLTEGIANFGETIAGGIESFSEFVLDVAELVRLYKEGGIDAVAEHFGITPEQVDLIEEGAEALVLFGVGIAGLTVGSKVISGLAALGALIAGISTGALLAAAVVGLIAVVIAFGERAWIAFIQLVILAIVWIQQLREKVEEAWAKIKEKTAEIWGAIVELIQEKIDAILESFGVTEEMKERWRQIWEDIKTIAETLIENARVAIMAKWEEIKQNAITAWETLVETVETILSPIVERVEQIWDLILLGLSVAWNLIKEALFGKVQETGETVGDELGVQADGWIDVVLATLGRWVQAGKEIMDGLLQGLKDNVGKIITFITDLAEKVISAIFGALGIESPSKVFEDVGKQLMTGLALGIDKNSLLPQVALDATAANIMNAGGGIASTGAAAGNTDRSFRPTINANFANPESPADIGTTLALMAMLEGAT